MARLGDGHGPDSCKLAKCVFVPRLQIETSQTRRSNATEQTCKQCLMRIRPELSSIYTCYYRLPLLFRPLYNSISCLSTDYKYPLSSGCNNLWTSVPIKKHSGPIKHHLQVCCGAEIEKPNYKLTTSPPRFLSFKLGSYQFTTLVSR